jgi:hypothetical protein
MSFYTVQGHNSKAVHRAYARKAQVIIPSLDEYERANANGKIIPISLQSGIANHGVQRGRG